MGMVSEFKGTTYNQTYSRIFKPSRAHKWIFPSTFYSVSLQDLDCAGIPLKSLTKFHA